MATGTEKVEMSEELRLRKDELEWREVEGEIVVLDARKSLYLSVSPSGAPLWTALADGATKEDLVAKLTETFGLEPDRAEQDVDSFLAMLEDQELLEE